LQAALEKFLFENTNYEYNSYLFTNELDRNYRVYFELGLFVFIYKSESKFVDFGFLCSAMYVVVFFKASFMPT